MNNKQLKTTHDVWKFVFSSLFKDQFELLASLVSLTAPIIL